MYRKNTIKLTRNIYHILWNHITETATRLNEIKYYGNLDKIKWLILISKITCCILYVMCVLKFKFSMRIKRKKIIEDLHDNVMFNMKLVRRY